MVTLLAWRLGVPLDGRRTGCWRRRWPAGVVMDTANFAHPNTTPRTLVVAAALREAGAPLCEIARRLYRTKPDGQLVLFGRVLARLESDCDGRLVWSTLELADLPPRARRRPSPRASSTSSPRRRRRGRDPLQGGDDGDDALSVRTRDGGVDATVLTGTFGGGGHARAAGATVSLPLVGGAPARSWPAPSSS